jgi:thiamine-monophosphate kinase
VNDRIRDETELIQNYLAPLAAGMPGAFGLVDDAALITTEPGTDIVVSTDPVIAGVHFFSDDEPADIAWKALAVNVSDLAAKGAQPFAYTMALAFPEPPLRAWMAAFSDGLREAQTAFGCALIGGDTDTTTGPLSVGVTAFGKVPRGAMVTRSGAGIGDHVFVSGTLGDAALGLALRRSGHAFGADLADADRAFLLRRYLRPLPRLDLVPLLRRYASAALDVSDGLLKDMARLFVPGTSSLTLEIARLPLSPPARAVLASHPERIDAALAGGDDYEILFAVAPGNRTALIQACDAQAIAIQELGRLTSGVGLSVLDSDGRALAIDRTGFDHFTRQR